MPPGPRGESLRRVLNDLETFAWLPANRRDALIAEYTANAWKLYQSENHEPRRSE